jgi:hypothetical protein
MSNPFPEYDILGWEVHHRRKRDSPSGTGRIGFENFDRDIGRSLPAGGPFAVKFFQGVED